MIEQVASKKMRLLLKIQSKTQKHYNYLQRKLKWKEHTEVTKMPCWKAWVKRPSGLIYKWREAQVLLRETTLIKVENVSLKQISIKDLSC
jgi:hypothetical protein